MLELVPSTLTLLMYASLVNTRNGRFEPECGGKEGRSKGVREGGREEGKKRGRDGRWDGISKIGRELMKGARDRKRKESKKGRRMGRAWEESKPDI